MGPVTDCLRSRLCVRLGNNCAVEERVATLAKEVATEHQLCAKDTGNGTWFRVVERGLGLDNLVRERQIIRSTRDDVRKAGGEAPDLQPMLFAGILLEGGIVGYDSNIETGGNGARYLGIG